MSISSALNSALSGLAAASRGADVVAGNVANALTEGHARREILLAPQLLGDTSGGVQVVGVTRVVDRGLLADRRLAGADAANRGQAAEVLLRLETAMGTPDDARSVSARLAAFDVALIEAASRPDSVVRLDAVLGRAADLVRAIGTAARDIQAVRAAADERIGREVAQLNIDLAEIARMNVQVMQLSPASRESSALLDLRQTLVDRVSAAIPLREVTNDRGQVTLFSTGGAVLLDGGRAGVFGFTPAGVITEDMTLASGALSGLTLNGRDLATGGPASVIAGGALAAGFAARDVSAPAAQARLDAVARDLVERFADPALDPTRAPGAPGLFTDAGLAFLPADAAGLAQRLAINDAVDPAKGGALWRLRDGLGAVIPGREGDSSLLAELQRALTAPRDPAPGPFHAGQRSLSALVGDMVSGLAAARISAQAEASFSVARSDALRRAELANGVDTDAEMQTLLLIEKAYAANARVMQAVDEMLNLLLGV